MTDPEKQPQDPSIQFGGSCACSRITYESRLLPNSSQACHCVTCRKLSGGPFMAFLDVDAKGILFYDNKEHLHYEGLPKDSIGGITFLRFAKSSDRAFCVDCYSPLAMRYKHEPDVTGLTLGSVDERTIKDGKVKDVLRPAANIFTSQKAWWYDTAKDDIPYHDRFRGSFEQDIKAWEGKEG